MVLVWVLAPLAALLLAGDMDRLPFLTSMCVFSMADYDMRASMLGILCRFVLLAAWLPSMPTLWRQLSLLGKRDVDDQEPSPPPTRLAAALAEVEG
jgi:hypothetical protein